MNLIFNFSARFCAVLRKKRASRKVLLGIAVLGLMAPSAGAAEPQLQLQKGERIAFLGNALAERMSLYGHFETLLHSRFPLYELKVRNFAWPAEEVSEQQRPNDYTKVDDPLAVFAPNLFICFFGFNESFAGPAGLEKFKSDYEKYIESMGSKYSTNGAKPRFVLVSPIAVEKTSDPLLPDGVKQNENLKLYTAGIADLAKKLGLPFVDLQAPTAKVFAEKDGAQFTINGVHINDEGDRVVGQILDRELFGSANPVTFSSERDQKLRSLINDKSWVHQQDYRMLNGWYVYGGRRTFDTETFPLEYKKIRAMAAVRDRLIWDIAQGKPASEGPDDSATGELFVPETRFGKMTYSEPKELRYLDTEESIKAMTVAPGYQVTPFASEKEFPELAKPVQIDFDNKGRLWVSCMPSYPLWKPGDAKPSDRLLIFEDTNNDGRADKVKVFYDQLHCPTSFEFWNGGVLVTSQPRTLFLKDTDGDDKADLVVPWMDGWATDDTHHRGGFEWSHGGKLHSLEGVAMSTALETPWGPFRNRGTPGAYVIDPRTWRVQHFVTPGYGNPWCFVFDKWGQGIVGDGTTAQQHWATALSGSQLGSRKGMNTVFNNEGMRPVIGSDFINSRHFPDEVQGQFFYACVINMNGIPRWELHDEGAGYDGKRLPDLVKSTDRNFRPADPKIGPDGALWFGDWHNALIGHMQYSQRDPNRDHARGRVYRLTATGRPLLKPVTQFGKSVPELLDQLKEYETRTRYRARRELRDRPAAEVVAATKRWVAGLDKSDKNYDLHLTEALWALQGHHAVDMALLKQVLAAKAPEARAAAIHVLADEWNILPSGRQTAALHNDPNHGRFLQLMASGSGSGVAPMSLSRVLDDAGYAGIINAQAGHLDLLAPLVSDENPRVRVEAVRALSFVPTMRSVELALEAARHPIDYYMDYVLQHTLGALEPVWKAAFDKGELAKNNQDGLDYLKAYVSGRPQLGAAQQALRKLLNTSDMKEADKESATRTVASARGRVAPGHDVFGRVCVACHKVGDKGIEFGPDLTKVAARLKREELIESILEPNAKVDPKYLMVNVTTKGGDELSGIIVSEDDATLTLKLGAGQVQEVKKSDIARRETSKSSNMPEGLAQSLSPEEFVDLIEYLAAQK